MGCETRVAGNNAGIVHTRDHLDAQIAEAVLKERVQLARHFEDHPVAAAGEERHVARKLDGIAEALLHGYEKRAAKGFRRCAPPKRRRKIPIGLAEALQAPAPLIFRPALRT